MTDVFLRSAGRPADPMFRTIWQNRAYIFSNALQDFFHKYAGTGIGLLWNIVHPLMLVVVFSFVFAFIMPSRYSPDGSREYPFVLFLCSGLLPWISFADGLQRATSTFTDNAGYLRKLPVPEEVYLAKTILGSSILLAINMVILVVVALVFGFHPLWSWLLLPVAGALMMSFALGLGTFLATLNVFLRDVSQATAIATQLWMWLTPIVYPVTALPSVLSKMQYLNPIMPFTQLFRELFLLGRAGSPVDWGLAIIWSALALLLGSWTLGRFRAELRDVL
jgi:lipopolysaccharide transport system permease protein